MTILLAHGLSQRLKVAAARVVYSHVEANLR
jgi:hypothetical protein